MSSNYIARCDPRKIIPIYPCRYVVADELLLTDSKQLPAALTPPAGVDQAPHHQLASLRQGYVYIYGNLSIDGTNVTDSKANWLIFRYQTRADDGNSLDEPTACADTFQFYKYTWKDGTPRSDWEADWQTYPYAFVNLCAINTCIAYSEERWPAYMFEALERDEGWRDRVMQPIDLQGNDPHMLSIDQLAHYVEDYKGIKCEERETNVVRHTPIGRLDIEPYERMKATHPERYSYARIIVLEDTLGEAKDLLRLAEVIEANIQAYESTYHYALTTAKAIAPYEQEIDKRYRNPEWGFVNKITHLGRQIVGNDPLNRSADAQRHDFAAFGSPEREESQQQLIGLWAALDKRPRWRNEVELALQGAEQHDCEACIDYSAGQLHHYLAGIKQSAEGAIRLKKQLQISGDSDGSNDTSDTGEETQYIKLLAAMTTVASRVIGSLQDTRALYRIELLMAEIATELAVTLDAGNSRIQLRQLEKLAGVTARSTRVLLSDLEATSRQNYENLLRGRSRTQVTTLSQQTASTRSAPGYSATISKQTSLTYFSYEKIEGTGAHLARSYGGLSFSGLGLVFGLLSARQTINEWNNNDFNARSGFGALANSPAMQLTASLIGVMAGGTSIYASPTYVQLNSNMLRLTERLQLRLRGNLPRQGAVVVPEKPIIGVSSRQLAQRALVASWLSSAALAVTLLISIGQTWEGIKQNDYARIVGHSLQGVGGVLLTSKLIGSGLVFTGLPYLASLGTALSAAAFPLAIIGGVLLAGGLFFASVSRSEMEQWVYEGFWGRKDPYWEDERLNINRQINDSIILMEAEPTNPVEAAQLKVFYNQEIRAFEQVIWRIQVKNIQDEDGRVTVEFPGLTTPDQLGQLSIRVQKYLQGIDAIMLQGASRWQTTSNQPIRREWLGPGVASLDLSAYAQEKKFRLEISYERTLPWGDTQRFTLNEPLVIEEPSQL
ncbi:toxin VasX [Nitrincola iocasae]|uniref:Toxin VasX N-terminal region domain-containing protein n=1 Tax=Nitrincola iocasae TaxID=2614693 RepID=A0A5J6LEC8_9GAMM|nr:toxin VasX [Nitrincola iocasae]QEW06945.1 hypothetical protein F5I99_10725 [Nitrincola iocasae]